MTEHTPATDFENLHPSERVPVKQFITGCNVASVPRVRTNVLGGRVVLDENPCIAELSNSR